MSCQLIHINIIVLSITGKLKILMMHKGKYRKLEGACSNNVGKERVTREQINNVNGQDRGTREHLFYHLNHYPF